MKRFHAAGICDCCDAPPEDERDEASPVEDLVRELEGLRRAGNELAEAAHRVSATYDGVHRLRLALSGWYMALANEWGRDKADKAWKHSTACAWHDGEPCTCREDPGENLSYGLGNPDWERDFEKDAE